MPIAFSKPHSYIPESLKSVLKIVKDGSDRVLPLYLLATEFISWVIPDTLLKVLLNTNKTGHHVLRYT